MMAAVILFGLNLSPLYNAIAQVESDRGVTSANVYQIRRIYVDDVNRLCPTMKFVYADAYDREQSEYMMYLYWRHYAYEYAKATRKPVTYELLAKMHNRGGRFWTKGGCMPGAAERYWNKVRKELFKEGFDK